MGRHRIFPYLLRGLTIRRADHVWCADITYVPVTRGFFYLVAVMDWATRHLLAWRLSNTMDVSLCVEAFDDALDRGTPEILNTDRSVLEPVSFGWPDSNTDRRFWRSAQGQRRSTSTSSATGWRPSGSSARGSASTTRCARIRPWVGVPRGKPIVKGRRCREKHPARRHPEERNRHTGPCGPGSPVSPPGPVGSKSQQSGGGYIFWWPERGTSRSADARSMWLQPHALLRPQTASPRASENFGNPPYFRPRTVQTNRTTTCLRLMDDVAKSGDEIVITKNGRPTARLVPYRKQFRDWFGADRGTIEILGDIVAPIDAEWEAHAHPDRTLNP